MSPASDIVLRLTFRDRSLNKHEHQEGGCSSVIHLPVTRDSNVFKGSVIDDIAAEVNLDEIREVFEHRDEELGVHGC